MTAVCPYARGSTIPVLQKRARLMPCSPASVSLRYPCDLTDAEWTHLAPLFPAASPARTPGRAPGRRGGSSTASSPSDALGVPGALCRGSLRRGRRRTRPAARGVCREAGHRSTRRGATPPPRRRSWRARVGKPRTHPGASRVMTGAHRSRGGNGLYGSICSGCCCRWRSPRPIPPTKRGRAAYGSGCNRYHHAWTSSRLMGPRVASRLRPGVRPKAPGGWRASHQHPIGRDAGADRSAGWWNGRWAGWGGRGA